MSGTFDINITSEPSNPDEQELTLLGMGDEETAVLIDVTTGEVIDLPDAPRLATGEPATKEAVQWYADRRTRTVARMEANRAGRAAYLAHCATVAEREYDGQYKRDTSLLQWLDGMYLPALEMFARAAIAGSKVRNTVINGLKLSFRTVGGGIEIEDESAAIEWARTACPDAIKVKESLLKTPIEKSLGKDSEFPAESGLYRIPKTDKFEVAA